MERELIEGGLHSLFVTRVETAAPFQQMPPHHTLLTVDASPFLAEAEYLLSQQTERETQGDAVD